MGMADETETAPLSFEDELKRLETIVQQLERGDVPLDKSISLYQEGESLRRQCQERLDAAEARIQQITASADGSAARTAPYPSE